MRLRRSADFAAVFAAGRRFNTRRLAVHVLLDRSVSPEGAPRVGFVVSSKVGNSVVRHRVTRRLREQLRPLLSQLRPGTDLVIRAFPAAAAAPSAELAADLRTALRKSGLAIGEPGTRVLGASVTR